MIDTRPAQTDGSGLWLCVLLVAVTAATCLFLQSRVLINPDVSFLAWTARQVLGPAVFGVDVYEVNPPLAFLMFSPAALAAPLLGLPLAINLWVTALVCLSVAVFWHACDATLRVPLTVALTLFVTLVFFRQFGQREYLAFILTVPYVAGYCRHRGVSVLSGVMAGIGFCIKPHFLIPLVLVFATRRRIRTEELAIAATGAAYAVVLLVFFQPYLFEFLPIARITYWAVHAETDSTWKMAAFILPSAIAFSLAGAPQPSARGFAAACFGFTIAAIIQNKGFSYHFHAAWGYLMLLLVARVFNPRRLVGIAAGLDILLMGYLIGGATISTYVLQQQDRQEIARLLPDIDRSPSFLSLSLGPFPAFPTALYTASEYKGLAIWPIFISTARSNEADPALRERATRLTFDQAIHELERQPALVIVERAPSAGGWERPQFDLLGWFKTDGGFRDQWQHYRYDRTIGRYELYRRG